MLLFSRCWASFHSLGLFAPVAARAQQDAVISGTVTSAEFSLPGVTVQVRSSMPGGQIRRTTFTDNSGKFTIALPPGVYDVTFSLPGFATVVRERVELTVGATVTLVIEMSVQFQEEVVVVGSRAQPRSVTESAVPVDVIPADELASQGDTDLTSQLRNSVPSFNVTRQPISDAAAIVRPANLRGLAPDHTLILVNGKRRNRAAVITWLGGGLSDGSQGPDISIIPPSR